MSESSASVVRPLSRQIHIEVQAFEHVNDSKMLIHFTKWIRYFYALSHWILRTWRTYGFYAKWTPEYVDWRYQKEMPKEDWKWFLVPSRRLTAWWFSEVWGVCMTRRAYCAHTHMYRSIKWKRERCQHINNQINESFEKKMKLTFSEAKSFYQGATVCALRSMFIKCLCDRTLLYYSYLARPLSTWSLIKPKSDWTQIYK